jgi:hypothetical protein
MSIFNWERTIISLLLPWIDRILLVACLWQRSYVLPARLEVGHCVVNIVGKPNSTGKKHVFDNLFVTQVLNILQSCNLVPERKQTFLYLLMSNSQENNKSTSNLKRHNKKQKRKSFFVLFNYTIEGCQRGQFLH